MSQRAFAGGVAEVGGVFGKELFETRLIDCFHISFFRRDHAFAEFRPNRLVHELHAFAFSAGDDVVKFLGRAFADDRGDGRCGEHNFVNGDAARFVDAFAKQLGDDTAKRSREHRANLRLLIGRENVDDPVNGFTGVVRVERSENQQTGFRSGEGEGNGFQIPHLADEDDVRIFPQRGAKSVGERRCLDRNFALGDDRFFVRVNELDRLFHGDDVAAEIRIDVVEQGGKRRRFSGTGRTGYEHEAGADVAELFDGFRHAEAFEGSDFGGDQPENRAEAVLLFEVVATEAGVFIHLVSEVEVAFFEIGFERFRVTNLREHFAEAGAEENRLIRDRDDRAVNTDFWRLPFGKVKIGTSCFNEVTEKSVNLGHGKLE